jgi:competence protein ComEC
LLRGKRIEALVEVADQPHRTTNGRRLSTVAFVRAFCVDGDSLWRKSRESIVIYVDTTTELSVGQMFTVKLYVNDFKDNSSYTRLMYARGITGYSFVSEKLVEDWNVGRVNSLEYKARELRNRVSTKLQSTLTSHDDAAVLTALLTGDRSQLSRQTKELYRRSGTSHVLALSGMHLSIIFLILNVLLKPVVLLGRKSNFVKSMVILLAIWFYAYVSGLSLSVCRAAIMITIAQLTLFTTTRGSVFNAILIAVFITLAISPMALFDISFQLSYAAMFSLLFFVPRFVRWVRVPKSVGWLRNLVAVTLAAQIGVIPIVIHVFGSISPMSLLINPLISITTPLVMIFGAIGTFIPFCSDICEMIFGIHNSIIGLVDSVKWGNIEGVFMSDLGVIIYYILLGVVMLIIKCKQKCNCSNEVMYVN